MSQGLQAGPYELLTRLSGGGMGEVFVARRHGAGAFEKEVALKLLLPHLVDDSEFVERFFDEARLAARMNHPNIIQIFDVGEADGRPYLAMALVEGISLSVLLRVLRGKRLMVPLPIARLIATGLLEALGYAHALTGSDKQPLSVVHRDVSPSNIMLSTAGAVLLTDFGIAKAAINMHLTRPGSLRGKAAYIAPEQTGSGPVNARTDLFSAATTLYETLTLTSPFRRGSDLDTIDSVRKDIPTPVSLIRSEVSDGMSLALQRAHAKDAAQRFESARAFREALIDGPVATAPELAEFIRLHCAEDLRQSTPGRLLGTSSLPGATPEAMAALQVPAPLLNRPTTSMPGPALEPLVVPRSRAMPALAAAMLLLLVSGLAWAFWPSPAPEVITKVEPPPSRPVAVPAKPEEVVPVAVLDEPKHVPRPVHVPHKPPEQRPETATESPRPADPPPLKVGYLTADAQPWAEVLFDGKELDQTPLSKFPVPVGKHTVLFKAQDGRVEKRPVNVEEGKVVTVRVEFP